MWTTSIPRQRGPNYVKTTISHRLPVKVVDVIDGPLVGSAVNEAPLLMQLCDAVKDYKRCTFHAICSLIPFSFF